MSYRWNTVENQQYHIFKPSSLTFWIWSYITYTVIEVSVYLGHRTYIHEKKKKIHVTSFSIILGPIQSSASFYNHVPSGFIKFITPRPMLIFSLSRLSSPRVRGKQAAEVIKSLETNPPWISGSGVFQDKTPPLTPFHLESPHPRACCLLQRWRHRNAWAWEGGTPGFSKGHSWICSWAFSDLSWEDGEGTLYHEKPA